MATPMQKNNDAREDTIILNVGGIKYETFPSTLSAFPNTLLGTMFSERNKSMLHPKNGNEYFIDRNGYAFRYILEFYRNGKILWRDDPDINVTRKEFEQEVEYFQIPAKDYMKLSGERTVSAKIDAFVTALKELINVAMDQLQTEVHLTFSQDGSSGLQYWLPASIQCEMISEIIRPFDKVGFIILSQFGEIIKRYLKSEIPEITCKLSDKSTSPPSFFGSKNNDTPPSYGFGATTSAPFGFGSTPSGFGVPSGKIPLGKANNQTGAAGGFGGFGFNNKDSKETDNIFRQRNHDSKSLELTITIDYDYTVEQILRNTVLADVLSAKNL